MVRRGTKYGCIFDRISQPVQLFSVGNINNFTLDYLPLESRANAVEITFNNEKKDYQRDTIIIYSSDYDAEEANISPTQITLDAITDPDEIYKEGKYYLRRNKHLLRTVTFAADIDAISCQVGDVILVQHDIPAWGFGGRIISADNNSIVLDREVMLDKDSEYEITIRLSDDTIIKRDILADESKNTNTVMLKTALDVLPAEYDVYSFGKKNISTKPFSIISMTRTSDTKITIEALEYNESVYNESEEILDIQYSQFNECMLSNLSLGQEYYIQKDGSIISRIDISWQSDKMICLFYDVYLSEDGINYNKILRTSDLTCVIDNVKTQCKYWVKVKTSNNKASQIKSIYITGKDLPPHNIEFFTLQQDNQNIIATINLLSDPDINCYEIRQGDSWENGYRIGTFNSSTYTFPASKNGTCTYLIKAIDNCGNESIKAKKAIINITNVEATNIIYSHTYDINDMTYNNMYKHRDYLLMATATKIKDLNKFADMFGELVFIEGQAYLPLIDLGENIIDKNCYWLDSKGVIHIQQIQKIKDLNKFADMFSKYDEYVAPLSLSSTFLNVSVDGINNNG